MEKSFVLSHGALQIPCKLRYPEDETIRRLVLGVHGFGGCTDEEYRLLGDLRGN